MSKLTAPSPDDYLSSTWTDGVTSTVNDLTDTYSRYTGTATVLSSGAWVDLTWTLTDGTGLGLSLASSTTFTLTAGIWTVIFTGICGTIASHTGTLFGLFKDTTHTTGTAYAEGQGSLLVSQVAGNLSAEIKSDGTATLVVSAFAVGASPSMTTTANTPRLTFSRKDTT